MFLYTINQSTERTHLGCCCNGSDGSALGEVKKKEVLITKI